MKIHFVCRGNVYRSRLAEAYSKSLIKDNDSTEITSSGIEASFALNGKIDSVTTKLLTKDGLTQYLSPSWKQTTQGMLDEADQVIFMSESLYKQAQKMFKLVENKVTTLNVPDKDGVYPEIKKQVNEIINL